MVRRRAIPPEPMTPHLTRLVTDRTPKLKLASLHAWRTLQNGRADLAVLPDETAGDLGYLLLRFRAEIAHEASVPRMSYSGFRSLGALQARDRGEDRRPL